MGPNGGSQSKEGKGVGFAGVDQQPNDGGKAWDRRPDYCGIDQGVLGELKFVDKPGGKPGKPYPTGGESAGRQGVED